MTNRALHSVGSREWAMRGFALVGSVIACLAFLFLPAQASEEEVVSGPGGVVQVFELEDQFGIVAGATEETKIILFSRDMEGGGIITEALSGKDGEFLAERDVVYVADISRMPGLVARFFAVPQMRQYSFPLLLDREGKVTAQWPDEVDRGTLITLDGLRVVSVEFFGDPDEISARLDDGNS